jgi:xanthine/uracil permease
MSMFNWTLVHGGRTPPPGAVVAPDERLSTPRMVGLGAQHVVAMFGATFVFPAIMGLDPNLAVLMSGVATILFLLIVKNRIPSYVGTSASFVAAVAAIRAQGGDSAAVTGAILIAGLILAAVGLVVHIGGAHIVRAVLPRPSPARS